MCKTTNARIKGEHPLHTSLRSLWTVITIYFSVKDHCAACFEIPIDIPTNFSFLLFSPLFSPFSFSPLLFCLFLYGPLCWPLCSYETWDSAAKGERVNETCSSEVRAPEPTPSCSLVRSECLGQLAPKRLYLAGTYSVVGSCNPTLAIRRTMSASRRSPSNSHLQTSLDALPFFAVRNCVKC